MSKSILSFCFLIFGFVLGSVFSGKGDSHPAAQNGTGNATVPPSKDLDLGRRSEDAFESSFLSDDRKKWMDNLSKYSGGWRSTDTSNEIRFELDYRRVVFEEFGSWKELSKTKVLLGPTMDFWIGNSIYNLHFPLRSDPQDSLFLGRTDEVSEDVEMVAFKRIQ